MVALDVASATSSISSFEAEGADFADKLSTCLAYLRDLLGA
jgi:hypothetical protein